MEKDWMYLEVEQTPTVILTIADQNFAFKVDDEIGQVIKNWRDKMDTKHIKD